MKTDQSELAKQAKLATVEACVVCKHGSGAWCQKCHVGKLIKMLGGETG